MLNRIIRRFTDHKKIVDLYLNKECTAEEFEKFLLDEISFLQEAEERLDKRIKEENDKLLNNLSRLHQVVMEYNIDQETLRNIIFTEFNHIYLKDHIL